MHEFLSTSFIAVVVNFSSEFTEPSLNNFALILRGWILCSGNRTISRVILYANYGYLSVHHSVFYNFFSRAIWDPHHLGRLLFFLALKFVTAPVIQLTLDDTLRRRSGPHVWGTGMHHDPVVSNYGKRSTKEVKVISYGHCWVIVCLWIPLPWYQYRGIALPVAFKLYRSKKYCPEADYKKKTELGRELIESVASWLPEEQRIEVLADTEYACRPVVLNQPQRIVFIGPTHMKADLFDRPGPYKGRGAPAKKGKKLLSPRELASSQKIAWKKEVLWLYGRQVEVLVKSQVCMWYQVADVRLVHVIVTRDPKGRLEDRAYFSTDAQMTIADVAQSFSRRWSQEEMHRNIKQHLGLQDPQNGWWRREAGNRPKQKKAGPAPHETRGRKATERTVPFILIVYGFVVVWYLLHGDPDEDVRRVKKLRPWYRHKIRVSFSDMLCSLRRELLLKDIFSNPANTLDSEKFPNKWIELILEG